jgi:hypothetical protein
MAKADIDFEKELCDVTNELWGAVSKNKLQKLHLTAEIVLPTSITNKKQLDI